MSNEITYAKLPGIYAAIKRSKECLYILLWNNLQGILWEKKRWRTENIQYYLLYKKIHISLFL